MTKTKTLRLTARPTVHKDGWYTTAFWLFSDTNKLVTEVEVTTVESAETAIAEWAAELGVPSGDDVDKDAPNCWAVSVVDVSGRWAPGFKKAFDRSNRYFDVEVVGAL